jgi:hypothetical protein
MKKGEEEEEEKGGRSSNSQTKQRTRNIWDTFVTLQFATPSTENELCADRYPFNGKILVILFIEHTFNLGGIFLNNMKAALLKCN